MKKDSSGSTRICLEKRVLIIPLSLLDGGCYPRITRLPRGAHPQQQQQHTIRQK